MLYGFAGFVTVPSTVVKLSNDHSIFVIDPPFPVVVKETPSLTVVKLLLVLNVPPFVGVVHIVTDVTVAWKPTLIPLISEVNLNVSCPEAFSAVIVAGNDVPFNVASKGELVFGPS